MCRDWRRNRIAYLFAMPAVVVIFAVIVFPFFYNVVLSLSEHVAHAIFTIGVSSGLHNYAKCSPIPMLWGHGAYS